jgi:hypothetical protein
MLFTKVAHFAHAGRQLLVVVAQLGKPVRRRDLFRVVVENALQPPDITDRAKGRSTDLANALGERVGHGEDLVGLFVQQQMIIPELWPGHVPVAACRKRQCPQQGISIQERYIDYPFVRCTALKSAESNPKWSRPSHV